MDNRFYPGVEADPAQLMDELHNIFISKYFNSKYEIHTVQIGAATVLQARKSSTLRDLAGLSSALTIKITPEHGGTRAEIGMQKWLDKAAIATVGLVVFPPLMALAAIGAYWQYKVTEDAWIIIEDHIAEKAGGYVPPLPGRCGTCGAANSAGSPFCSVCGANMRVGLTCASCGTEQRDPSARFCNRCGKPLGGDS
jgi:hypothetical protein